MSAVFGSWPMTLQPQPMSTSRPWCFSLGMQSNESGHCLGTDSTPKRPGSRGWVSQEEPELTNAAVYTDVGLFWIMGACGPATKGEAILQ